MKPSCPVSAGLVHRTGLIDARDRLTKCFTNKVSSSPLRQRWNRRLDVLGEDPFGDPHRPSEARIELATYPEAVILTSLFASPHGETTHDCQSRRHNASASLPTNSLRA
ncbi:hypothetical protein [Streptomyces sp. NPDC048309]|uniref:hypothetical protein n=1 Tax=Streptomyces sp. NPDC048309 TaxID=3154618 RepID=UPI0033C456E4